MRNIRLITRLDVKGPNLIKGVHLEGLRVVGLPQVFSRKYYEDGIDEIVFIDTVASLYGRNNLTEIVKETANEIFIPMTVGGGIRSLEDVTLLLRSGADKVAINTAAVKDPSLISRVANRYGSQCMVLSIEAKRSEPGRWEVYTDNGRERTGLDVLEWVKKAVKLGAGEVLLTSVDQEGTRRGFDVDLVRRVADEVPVPVIASGGMGTLEHFSEVVKNGHADAVAIADVFHFNRYSVGQVREFALSQGICVRIFR